MNASASGGPHYKNDLGRGREEPFLSSRLERVRRVASARPGFPFQKAPSMARSPLFDSTMTVFHVGPDSLPTSTPRANETPCEDCGGTAFERNAYERRCVMCGHIRDRNHRAARPNRWARLQEGK